MSPPNRDLDSPLGPVNPYQSPAAAEPSQPRGALVFMARVALALVALLLLIRGVMLTVAWVGILGRTGVPSDHFMAAILVKDGSYAVTALLGGMLLLVPNRYSWWGGVVNWALYLGFEVLLVTTGGLLGWQFPVRHEAELFTEVMTRSIAWGVVGLAVLFWRPVMERCGVARVSRVVTLAALVAGGYFMALLVNAWSGLR